MKLKSHIMKKHFILTLSLCLSAALLTISVEGISRALETKSPINTIAMRFPVSDSYSTTAKINKEEESVIKGIKQTTCNVIRIIAGQFKKDVTITFKN